MKILLGTYTRRISEGIYQIDLNQENESLENLELVAKAQNPTYLDQNGETIYSVYEDEVGGGVAVWSLEEDGQLKLENAITKEGNPPCYVYYDQESKRLFDANYHLGEVNVYKDRKIDGTLSYGKNAHAHFIHKNPRSGLTYVCDLGNDKVYQYKDDVEETFVLNMDNGSGPRHIAFHPEKEFFYVFAELNSTVTVVKEAEGKLERIQVLSTLPKQNIESSGAAIRLSHDARHLYVSNRGHDSITMFEVLEDGSLKYKQNISTEGEHPRDFAISPDDQYLVVANRDTDNLTLFKRSLKTGRLKLVQKDVFAPEAVAVHFLKR